MRPCETARDIISHTFDHNFVLDTDLEKSQQLYFMCFFVLGWVSVVSFGKILVDKAEKSTQSQNETQQDVNHNVKLLQMILRIVLIIIHQSI